MTLYSRIRPNILPDRRQPRRLRAIQGIPSVSERARRAPLAPMRLRRPGAAFAARQPGHTRIRWVWPGSVDSLDHLRSLMAARTENDRSAQVFGWTERRSEYCRPGDAPAGRRVDSAIMLFKAAQARPQLGCNPLKKQEFPITQMPAQPELFDKSIPQR